MAITLAQLGTVLAVEHTSSIKGAAAELRVTQPSVSSGLAALEKEVGVRLVERRGRGIELSAADMALVLFASKVLGLLKEGRAAAPERREPKIAAVNTAGEYIVAPVAQAFRHPRVDIRLEERSYQGIPYSSWYQSGALLADGLYEVRLARGHAPLLW